MAPVAPPVSTPMNQSVSTYRVVTISPVCPHRIVTIVLSVGIES